MYTSLSQLEKRINPQNILRLADDDIDGVADEQVINQAIADADAVIDAYLRNRYDVPFSTVPDIIESISAVISINNLYARRKELIPDEHKTRFEKAIELLEDIYRGKINIGTDILQSELDSTTLNQDKTFSSDSLEDF